MNATFKNLACAVMFLVGLMVSNQLEAGNRTISGAFDGTEASMPANPSNCDVTPRPYLDVGTFQVSSSGTYRLVDAGNDFAFVAPDGDIADIVLLLYSGPFDPNTPAANRLAVIDIAESLALTSGTPYRVVVQHWCDEIVGSFAVVVDGPGDISGLGFNSLAYTLGEFLEGTATANFGDLGVHRYQSSGPIALPRAGNYYFAELGAYLTGGFAYIRVYDQAFDPDNPQNNLLAESGIGSAGVITLDGSGTYVFVAVDLFDTVTAWQFVLFPPGSVSFNPGLTAAWGTPGVEAAGVLMEVFQDTNLLFMAWFTYPDQLLVSQAAGNAIESAEIDSQAEAAVGSSDQRWLTAFGILPEDSNFMNIAYENSTGGLFNKAMPVATTDPNYGTGWIELFSCSHFALNYNLPDGLVRTTEMRRLVDDGVAYCRSFIKAAPPSPPF